MIHEELVDLIAEAIYCGLRDAKKLINIKDYVELSSKEKEFYLGMAHNIINIFDDYYDAELDDDDILDDDWDQYEEETRGIDDW